MLPNVQSITDIETDAVSVTKIREGGYSSEYLSKGAAYDLRLEVSHLVEKNTKLERHLLKLSKEVHAATDAPAYTLQAYLVVRCPKGINPTDVEKVARAVVALSTDANLTKIVAWES